MVDDTPVQKLPEQEKNTSEKFTTHTVVKGDTLYSLAKKYGTTVPEIVALKKMGKDQHWTDLYYDIFQRKIVLHKKFSLF